MYTDKDSNLISELQSLLGLINYLQPFLPNLASNTTFLREQVTNWDWNPSTNQAFNSFKSWISNMLLKTTLAYYDCTKPLILQTDASEYGLSTALIQNNRPIAFTSKTLTDAVTRYANIERECLSVVFGLEKFHTYIYHRHIIIQNDHKPLEMIQRKPIQAAPPRLQCMLLKLQKYYYTIQYILGKDMVLADRLSRFPSCTENSPIILHHNIHTINFNSECLNIIKCATERDPIHSTLYRLTLNGWPENFRSVPHIACHSWSSCDQLTVENGVLIKSDRVCILPELQDRTLYDLHDGNLGVEKMTHLTRSSVYWQGINSDIIDYVRQCTMCVKHKALQSVQPMLPCDVPEGPWQEIAADYFTHSSKDYLLIADTFSKYPFVYSIHSKTHNSLIQCLQDLFSQFGMPLCFLSDNGPPFSSEPFSSFLTSLGIEYITSSPLYPQSNGFIERQIKTIKTALTTAQHSRYLHNTHLKYPPFNTHWTQFAIPP